MPSWITPTAVHSKCGEMVGGEATKAIDDDTLTYWRHNSTCYHWIILDLGQTETVSKVRLYQSGIASRRWGITDGLDVFVSDNPANFGSAVWTGALDATGWQESGAFSKNGRYVKLVSKSNSELQLLYEFDAYCATPKTGSDSGVGAESLGARILGAVESGSGIDALSQLIATLTKSDQGTGADVVTALMNILYKNDVGIGADALTSLLAFITQSDTGSGAELLRARALGALDQGAGADALSELIATILKTDSGIGTDTLSELLATIQKADSGSGIEASTKAVFIFILLKLLHERQVNIMALQDDRPVNILLSQEVIQS